MSNALAIAAVTAVLRDLLNNGIIDHDLSTQVGSAVTVTALPPDRIQVGTEEKPQINLFLYRVAPNPGWRNVGLPSRNDQGDLVTNPPLALDLDYLLTAYGKNDFDGEILLGYAMQMLHQTPVLLRNDIRRALGSSPPGTGGPPVTSDILPLHKLQAADLADQVEQIKITPQTLNTEEISKLWTAMQAHYRPSAAYHVSVVLIEGTRTGRSALPVLTRGETDSSTGRDQGISVQSNPLPAVPTLLGLRVPNVQTALRAGVNFDKLRLFGHHLVADELTAVFQHSRLNIEIPIGSAGVTLLAPDNTAADLAKDPSLRLADTGLEIDLEKAAGNWAAGLYSVAVRLGSPGQNDAPTTNSLNVAVAPEFETTGKGGPIFTQDANNHPIIRMTCNPPIFRGQKVSLVIGDHELIGASEYPETDVPAEQTNKVVFQNTLPPEWKETKQLARLRVDGVESIFILQPENQAPQFDDSQRIVIKAYA